jgi:hypothetical protein
MNAEAEKEGLCASYRIRRLPTNLQKLGRCKEKFSPSDSRGNVAPPTPSYRTLE